MKVKKIAITFFIITLISGVLAFGGVNYYNANYLADNTAFCKNIKKEKKKYCKTDKIRLYNTDINLGGEFEFIVKRGSVELDSLDVDSLKIIRKRIADQALKNSFFIFSRNKRNLARAIIQYQNSDNTDSKELLLDDISKSTEIISYIQMADKVKVVKNKSFPKVLNAKDIKYLAIYNDQIYNYYTRAGKLVYREYSPNGTILRFQIFDNNYNFYTYDNKERLIEYSNGLEIFDSQNNLLYALTSEDRDYPTFRKSLPDGNEKRRKFLKKLNNPNTNIYKSLTPVIDQYYDKGSSKEMVNALNVYFDDLKDTNPKLYKEYKKLVGKTNFTLNFVKYNDRYIFAINNSNLPGVDKIAASMAITANKFHGRCSEPNLKVLIPRDLIGVYFYDIKFLGSSGHIKCKAHIPCSACSKNVSLWGWKYPAK